MRHASLIDHVEAFLGRIAAGWTKDIDGRAVEFQVVSHESDRFRGLLVLSTLGLSNIPLKSETTGKAIRHELVLLVRDVPGARGLVGVLQQIGRGAIGSQSALLRGDFIAPRSPLIAGSPLEGFYVSLPVFLPDAFAVHDPGGENIVFAWLVPISRSEAQFVSENRGGPFEDLLVERDPDLFDLERESLL